METYARETSDGGAEIGVIHDDAYIPLASVEGWRLEGLAENARDRGDTVKASSRKRGSRAAKDASADAGKDG